MSSSWECPRCGTIWAYWVAKCTCVRPTVVVTDKTFIPTTQTMTIKCTCGTTTVCPVHDVRVVYGSGVNP